MQNDQHPGDLPPWYGPPRSILPGTATTTHIIGPIPKTVVAPTAIR